MSRYTEEFERFWKAYPARWNKELGTRVKRKKYPAFEKWQKLSQEVKNECLSKVSQIRRSEGAFVRDAVTWLNQYGWEDIESPKKKYQPVLPPALTQNVLKTVDSVVVNVNNERNKQLEKLAKAEREKRWELKGGRN